MGTEMMVLHSCRRIKSVSHTNALRAGRGRSAGGPRWAARWRASGVTRRALGTAPASVRPHASCSLLPGHSAVRPLPHRRQGNRRGQLG